MLSVVPRIVISCTIALAVTLSPQPPADARGADTPPRSATASAATGGVVLDGWGGIHAFGGASISTAGAPYWSGWDIARSLRLQPGGAGGWVLDGYGGIHAFGGASPIATPAYWSGWDIARDLVVLADGRSGYLLDGYGGLHPFGAALALAGVPYWSGWDIARGLALHLNAGGQPDGGWLLDGYGGIHSFGAAPSWPSSHYVPGLDVWRHLHATSAAGGIMVGRWGIVDSVGSTPGIPWSGMPDWGAWDIVRDVVPVNPQGGWSAQPVRVGGAAALMSAMQSLDRRQRGVPALTEDRSLDSIAGGSWTYNLTGCGGPAMTIPSRSADMLARNYFAHEIAGCSGARYVFTTYENALPWQSAGENIAWRTDGTSVVDAAWRINDQWLNSPEHLANIVNRGFSRVGCGVAFSTGAYQGATGPLWVWTCEFTG